MREKEPARLRLWDVTPDGLLHTSQQVRMKSLLSYEGSGRFGTGRVKRATVDYSIDSSRGKGSFSKIPGAK